MKQNSKGKVEETDKVALKIKQSVLKEAEKKGYITETDRGWMINIYYYTDDVEPRGEACIFGLIDTAISKTRQETIDEINRKNEEFNVSGDFDINLTEEGIEQARQDSPTATPATEEELLKKLGIRKGYYRITDKRCNDITHTDKILRIIREQGLKGQEIRRNQRGSSSRATAFEEVREWLKKEYATMTNISKTERKGDDVINYRFFDGYNFALDELMREFDKKFKVKPKED